MKSNKPPADLAAYAADQGLTAQELEQVCRMLGRIPNRLEVALFAVMWSEHCSYKSSRVHLKRLPTKGGAVLQGPGENAGIIDIGGPYAIAFKIESHNHPSYIEPYQGAATGVGGILRDIFTMGARPIAIMDCLFFGETDHPKTPYLLDGVVAGIAGYGNCMGIPTVGGMTVFHPTYNENILVNAFCLGLVEKEKIFRGTASGEGNAVIYLGSRTGKDGIHGATMASDAFGEETEHKRPTVQVGDPFAEKLVMEACLEIMEKHLVSGIQDMGAAGLTCSTFEMAARGGAGIDLNLDRVPLREAVMSPWEIMLSESQERMLLVAPPENVAAIQAIAKRWGLAASVVGTVTSREEVRITYRGEEVAKLPPKFLADEAPIYQRPMQAPPPRAEDNARLLASVPPIGDWPAALRRYLRHPDQGRKQWITRQYDSMIGTATLSGELCDAAVLRIKETGQGLALSSDVNHLYCRRDPRQGTKQAVAEAARNLYMSGAQPLGITNCLNFGNPENPEVMWQFGQAIDGLSEAARFFGTPVVSGNVSFYNQTEGKNIDPTPTIVMVGLMERAERRMTAPFKAAGDHLFLLGETREEEIGLSSFVSRLHGREEGAMPRLDLEREKALGEWMLAAAGQEILHSAHDCADGGLLLALLECALASEGLGFALEALPAQRLDAYLFSESQGRAVISAAPERAAAVEALAQQRHFPCRRLGIVVGGRCSIPGAFDLALESLRGDWAQALPLKGK